MPIANPYVAAPARKNVRLAKISATLWPLIVLHAVVRERFPSPMNTKMNAKMNTKMNMKMLRAPALAIALMGASTLASYAIDPIGTWLTEEGKATVRVADCGGALCATIVSLREPNDPQTGRPKTDGYNIDAGKRNRPIVGVQILMGLRPQGANKWSGQVYNPEDGKTYDANVVLENANILKVQGCVLFICKTNTWTRKG
jgi:uncharacterized protein (DUF2147 family)